MAEILLQQTMDAPWIFFEPQAAGTVAFDVNKHITGCVHRLMDSKMFIRGRRFAGGISYKRRD